MRPQPQDEPQELTTEDHVRIVVWLTCLFAQIGEAVFRDDKGSRWGEGWSLAFPVVVTLVVAGLSGHDPTPFWILLGCFAFGCLNHWRQVHRRRRRGEHVFSYSDGESGFARIKLFWRWRLFSDRFGKGFLEPFTCMAVGGLGHDVNPAFTGFMLAQAFALAFKRTVIAHLARRQQEDRRDAELLARGHAHHETPAVPSASPAKAVPPARRASPGNADPQMADYLRQFPGGRGP